MTDTKYKLAILIDGDNAEASLIEQMLNEASKFGRVTIRRIYADWTSNYMNSWKNQLNKFAIRPMQKFSYTKGKNSTDSALIIDAMDIMHSKLVDGFCLVSSDSDYTGIAHRLREEGLFVMGIGRSNTPEAFVKSCENFIYTEILTLPSHKITPAENRTRNEEIRVKHPRAGSEGNKEEIKKSHPEAPKPHALKNAESRHESRTSGTIGKPGLVNKVTNHPLDISLIDNAFDMVVDDLTGLAYAGQLANAIRKIDSTFDPRNFDCNSFGKFLEALKPRYEIIKDDKGTMQVSRKE